MEKAAGDASATDTAALGRVVEPLVTDAHDGDSADADAHDDADAHLDEAYGDDVHVEGAEEESVGVDAVAEEGASDDETPRKPLMQSQVKLLMAKQAPKVLRNPPQVNLHKVHLAASWHRNPDRSRSQQAEPLKARSPRRASARRERSQTDRQERSQNQSAAATTPLADQYVAALQWPRQAAGKTQRVPTVDDWSRSTQSTGEPSSVL